MSVDHCVTMLYHRQPNAILILLRAVAAVVVGGAFLMDCIILYLLPVGRSGSRSVSLWFEQIMLRFVVGLEARHKISIF